jgi:polyisoprenoid-binding protein YceI
MNSPGIKRTLAIVGAGALLAWTGLGLVAWSSAARRVTVDFEDETSHAGERADTLALRDELGALHQDLRALATAMGENLQALQDGLLDSQDEHAAAMELRLAALRDEVGSRTSSPSSDELADLVRELAALSDAVSASGASGSAAQFVTPAPSVEPLVSEPAATAPLVAAAPAEQPPVVAPAELAAAPAPAAAQPRKSFLAFKLPSDDFRLDERRAWSILPTLSRVGFDAKTTLHDFTATTSTLEGELEADLSRPGDAPRAQIRAQAATLVSGDDDRDEAMREHLAVAEHATLEFELTRFEPAEVDLTAQRATGTAHGRLRLRGVTQEVAMPVRLTIDEARRLWVEGEMMLDLTRFQVPVPNKLGLISMEEEVKVWISLRLRANPRSEG